MQFHYFEEEVRILDKIIVAVLSALIVIVGEVLKDKDDD